MISGLLVAFLAGAISIVYLLFHLDKGRRRLAHVPGPEPLPILGNALELSTDGHVFYKQLLENQAKFGSLFKFMFGPRPVVMTSNPEGIEILLSSTKNLTKAYEYAYIHPWLKLGLLTSTGEKWRSRRKMLTPTFHFRILNDFMGVICEQTSVLIDRLEEVCDQGEIDTFPYITLCALDIICETAMGRKVNAQLSGGDSEYVTAVKRISDIVMRRMRLPWLQPKLLFKLTKEGRDHDRYLKILHEFTRDVIKERAIAMEGNMVDVDSDDEEFERQKKGRRLAFLDLLLSMAKDSGLTHDDIQEEVDTFMFEGHDTTAASMNWTVHLIGSHPEVQKKLHEEVDRVFGKSDRPAKMADIRELKYLETVIKESLRLYPSVPFFGRTLEEDTKLNGYMIPKGTSVFALVLALHRNPETFPDPEKFDPERFNQEKMAKRHPYAYVPFSAGPRNCIGQKFAQNEEKVVLSSILRRFHIESRQEEKDLKPESALILRPLNGIMVKLTRRY